MNNNVKDFNRRKALDGAPVCCLDPRLEVSNVQAREKTKGYPYSVRADINGETHDFTDDGKYYGAFAIKHPYDLYLKN